MPRSGFTVFSMKTCSPSFLRVKVVAELFLALWTLNGETDSLRCTIPSNTGVAIPASLEIGGCSSGRRRTSRRGY